MKYQISATTENKIKTLKEENQRIIFGLCALFRLTNSEVNLLIYSFNRLEAERNNDQTGLPGRIRPYLLRSDINTATKEKAFNHLFRIGFLVIYQTSRNLDSFQSDEIKYLFNGDMLMSAELINQEY